MMFKVVVRDSRTGNQVSKYIYDSVAKMNKFGNDQLWRKHKQDDYKSKETYCEVFRMSGNDWEPLALAEDRLDIDFEYNWENAEITS